MPTPRPFEQETADYICDRLAEGFSLNEICREEGMPAKSTVFKWLGSNSDFANQYARAREAQADVLVDEILNISDDAQNDWMERQGERSVGWELNGEHIQRSKLRVDARKWIASKMKPKKYGDKLTTEIGGIDGAPIETNTTFTDAKEAMLAYASLRKQTKPE